MTLTGVSNCILGQYKEKNCISAGFMELVTGSEPVTSYLPRTGTKEKY